jgi:hypothetical protein
MNSIYLWIMRMSSDAALPLGPPRPGGRIMGDET